MIKRMMRKMTKSTAVEYTPWRSVDRALKFFTGSPTFSSRINFSYFRDRPCDPCDLFARKKTWKLSSLLCTKNNHGSKIGLSNFLRGPLLLNSDRRSVTVSSIHAPNSKWRPGQNLGREKFKVGKFAETRSPFEISALWALFVDHLYKNLIFQWKIIWTKKIFRTEKSKSGNLPKRALLLEFLD